MTEELPRTTNDLQKHIAAYEADNADECTLRKYVAMNVEIISYLSTGGEFDGLARLILRSVQRFGGFEVVALRIQDGDDYPYYIQNGFSDDFVKAENYLCERNEKGEPARDNTGNVLLDCMCGNIIRGRTDPKLPFFTEGGSFWSNCTTELLANTSEKERQGRTRNRCNIEGYESVAIIPMRTKKGIVGLLYISDRRRDRFSLFMIRLLEAMAITIGNYYVCKQVEESLREKETLLRSITENSPDPIFIKDRQSRIIYGNPSLFEVWGKTREEVIGKNDMELYADPAIAEALMQHDRTVMASGTSQVMEEVVQTAKHGLRTYLSTKTPYRDGSGGIIGIVCIARDITERRRMEVALRESEERTRSFLEDSGTIVWMKDENGRYTFLSRSFEKYFGIRYTDCEGKKDIELWPPETVEQFRENDRKVLSSGRSFEVVEKLSRPGWDERWWMISKFLFVNAVGQRFVAGLGIDITAYKRAEEEVLRNQEKLRSLTIELSLVEERERRKLSEYLHDHVGQSLAAAKMNLMALRPFGTDEGFMKAFARTKDCIEEALSSARSTTFELSLPILYELGFGAALDWLAEQVQAQGITCTVIDERKQWDLDDGTRIILFKTVRELLMNAVKHSRARNVSVALRENRGRIEVVVADDGAGFAVEAEDGLKGLPGFGLFNIGEQIRHLGGEMHIDSRPGGGTKISLHCPLRRG